MKKANHQSDHSSGKLTVENRCPVDSEDCNGVDIPAKERFPIVGLGASAGGLAAFEAFFSAMPADTEPGMAFVLVQHLAPDHKSMLTDLITRYTCMPVYEVEDGMRVQVNCTYIIPPNKDMAFLNGALYLIEPVAPRGQRMPIDFFFRSLAQDLRERAICIVLSGTGSDGAQGVRDIKGEGGMAMVQNPEQIEYGGMPRSAIATGLVDYILEPAEMPGQLLAYIEHAFGGNKTSISNRATTSENTMKKIIILLRNHTGHDFSGYKSNTIGRRLERRMAVNQIDGLEDYYMFMMQNDSEVITLYNEILIGVTSFFRDPDAFKALEEKAIPRVLGAKENGAVVRVWVPGCSTGEEAYSVAILFYEGMAKMKQNCQVQIFATDIDCRAIDIARAGVYPVSIASDVTPLRLERYFVKSPDGNSYRINKCIRDMLVFSEQSVIKDPPFSKLDLVSCRNMLIYMGADLQKKIIPLFHYALNPDGILFLGTSETIGEFIDLFSVIDRKSKLYQRKPAYAGWKDPELGRFLPLMTGKRVVKKESSAMPEVRETIREVFERELLMTYAPASVVVDERGEILYVHGHTGKYIELPSGAPGVNIISMACEELRRQLNITLHKAMVQNQLVRMDSLRIGNRGDGACINLIIEPLNTGLNQEKKAYMIVFEPGTPTPAISTPDNGIFIEIEDDFDMDPRILELQQALRAKEDYLLTTTEEMETANEDLKSANEELQSVNEELQSTNEELETSKEELQSINEELSTVNSELQQKVMDLSLINNDMNNLLAGTGVGTLFVNHELIIQRFTPAITPVINLIPSDVGRPVGHIVANLVGYDRLVGDVRAVLNSLIPREVEVQTILGAWYLLRIMPYRTLDNVIEGAVIIFIDITDMKRTRAMLQQAMEERQLLLEANPQGVIFIDRTGRIVNANPNAEMILGLSLEEMQSSGYRFPFRETAVEGDAITDDNSDPTALAILTGQAVHGLIMPVIVPGKESASWLRVNAVPQFNPGEKIAYQVCITFEAVSE